MSHVDTSTNVHCANIIFNKTMLPIYWCLTDLKHEDTKEAIKKTDLLIGGGSGEHPALHIKNADILPIWLADICSHEDNEEFVLIDGEEVHPYDFLKEQLSKRNIETQFPNSHHNFMNISNWPIATLSELQKELDEISDNKDFKIGFAEDELLISVANFILYEMPDDFFSEDILKFVKDFRFSDMSYAKKPFFTIQYPLNHQKSGKMIKNNRAVWGYSLNDYKNGE